VTTFKPGDRVRRLTDGREYTVSLAPVTAIAAYNTETGDTALVDAREFEPIPADVRLDVAVNSLLAVVEDPEKRDLYARTVLAALDMMEGKS
jgi:hypothetical protein